LNDPRVWVLLCSRTGANNQALALARALGVPFAAKRLRHFRWRAFGHRLGATRLTLRPQSYAELAPPWPELVIAVSRGNVPVARWIRARSSGRSKIVFLGNPRTDPGAFDAIVTTADHLHPRGDNVVVLPLPVGRGPHDRQPDDPPDWCRDLPGPRLLLLVGGPVKHWTLTEPAVAGVVTTLVDKANARGGSVIVCGSPRTPEPLIQAAEQALATAEHGCVAPLRTGGIDALLAFADEVFVTGDSMAMAAEAVLTGKPVGLIPLELTNEGRRKLGESVADDSSGSNRRDLRRFWHGLWSRGLAGKLEGPRAASIEPSAVTAARAVQSLCGIPEFTKENPLDPLAQVPHEKPR
jgi:mitochondrial fission protein ELM1